MSTAATAPYVQPKRPKPVTKIDRPAETSTRAGMASPRPQATDRHCDSRRLPGTCR
ncbi:hypothetical protein OHB01_14910 [Microbispora hainanensis]|uniref:Uncharacterized protein n=1 Tax=Microbispora hainanensis TaxID=568844 RepID=A0ABZ1SL56_9ACTN|nr:hypothetical protein [Microbispora hainanensis]